jgi:predicted MFS family arabinose efflux permease
MAKHKELWRALLATAFIGACGGIFGATLNNYLADVHRFSAAARGWLEFPRELPGFLMMFVSALMLRWCRETQMAAIAMLFTAVGAAGYAFLSSGVAALVLLTVIGSLGDHIIFAVESPIVLKLSKDGKEGKSLGQFGGARNLGVIIGVAAVYLLSRFLSANYMLYYCLSAVAALAAAMLYSSMRIGHGEERTARFVLKPKYRRFYAVSALFGIRKQIFLVFGGWVLIKLYGVPLSTVALLYFISAAIGVVFRPLLGEVIDWFGERTVLAADQLVLCFVCLSYAFASLVLPKPYDLYLLYATYVLDAVLFALRVALTTYLKKIADSPADITPSISVGITIDHAVSMTIPVFSGFVWEHWGYRWVFVIATIVGMAGVIVCLGIKLPARKKTITYAPAPSS